MATQYQGRRRKVDQEDKTKTETMSHAPHEPIRLLVVNPNSSEPMTRGIEEAIQTVPVFDTTEISTYTGPASSPASINDDEGIHASYQAVAPSLRPAQLQEYDGVLVACFSKHPLVPHLARQQGKNGLLTATGIFEASVLAALALLTPLPSPFDPPSSPTKWGIVTTGTFWEGHLADGVGELLGNGPATNSRFAGVESTGLDASDFHGAVGPALVRERLQGATRRLLQKGTVDCVVMGCAGMAGVEAVIRAVAVDEYGMEAGGRVHIVDGIKAGIGMLEQMVKNKRLFQQR